jgi:hypothetical protein
MVRDSGQIGSSPWDATAGSLLGCTITDWLSRKIGEVGIEKMVKPVRLKSVQEN